MMLVSMNYTQAVLLLLSNPALGWVLGFGWTQGGNRLVAVPATPSTPPLDADFANRTASPPKGKEVDILRVLQLTAKTPGVAQVPGPIVDVPAFKLRPAFGQVQVPDGARVTSALSSPDGFTIIFVYRQHRKTLGTLVSVHAPGRVTPWFQLASNLRSGQLVLHYRLTTDVKLHQNSWSLRPAARAAAMHHPNAVASPVPRKRGGLGWTYVHLSLNTTTNLLRLQLECQPPRLQPLAGTGRRAPRVPRPAQPRPTPRMDVPDDALVYFRQEPGFKKKFLGSMQVAKVYPYATTEHSDWACEGYQLVRQRP